MTEGLIEDKQGEFRAERGCVDQIFTKSRKVRKHERKTKNVGGFYGFGEGIR